MMILLEIDIPKLNKEGLQMRDSFVFVIELSSSSMIE